MREDFIEFKTAKLAKEKGFDIEQEYYFTDILSKFPVVDVVFHTDLSLKPDYYYNAPTQSLLQRWLREKHYVDIHIKRQKPRYTGYTVEVYIVKPKDSTYIYFGLKEDDNNQYKIFDVYEEALEEALYQALLKI